jgi:FkbM family methyltransferase
MCSSGLKSRSKLADRPPAERRFSASAGLKRLAGRLPLRVQQELKRIYFARGLRNGTFRSDEREFQRLEEWLETGDWVLDVGANVGHYTAKLSKVVGASGRVLAFEPMRETFELLSANVARLPSRNVTLFNVAASDCTRLAGMTIPRSDEDVENYYMAHLAEGIGTSSVLCLAVDALGLAAKIKLAKVDVEGHEFAALKGMERIIARDRPILIVEGNSEKVEAFLAQYGYEAKHDEQSPNRVYTCNSPQLR